MEDEAIPTGTALEHRRRAPIKLVGIISAAVAAVLVATVAALWIWRVDLVASAALGTLEDAGFGPARAKFERVDLDGLRVRDIELFAGAVRVAEVAAAYRPFRLLGGRIDSVEVRSPQASVVLAGGRITIGGRALPATGGSGGPAGGGIAIDALRIDDARLAVDGPGGRVEANFSTTLALAAGDLRNASFAVDVDLPIGGVRQAVHIAVPEFSFAAHEQDGLRLVLANARVVPKDLPWALEGIAGELAWRPDRATAKLAVAKASHRGEPPLVVPLRLTLAGEMAGSRVDFTARAEVDAVSGKGRFAVAAKGRHDLETDRGSATIAPARLVFDPKGAQPADYAPAVGALFADVAGSVGISGSLGWRGGAITPNVSVRLSDVALAASGAKVSGLSGDVKVVGLSPPATAPGQILKAKVEFGGLPPANATLAFRVLPAPALGVEALDLDFAGGRISASPFVIEPDKPRAETRLAIANLDLAELLKIVDLEGVSGTGRIDGIIPLGFADERLTVGDGRLAASGPGVLRIGKDTLPKELGAAGQAAELAIQALANFHYDSLAIELAKSGAGDGFILLRLQGRNPTVLEGHPFKFNIKLESNFDRLTAFALRSMAAAQELLRQAAGSAR